MLKKISVTNSAAVEKCSSKIKLKLFTWGNLMLKQKPHARGTRTYIQTIKHTMLHIWKSCRNIFQVKQK